MVSLVVVVVIALGSSEVVLGEPWQVFGQQQGAIAHVAGPPWSLLIDRMVDLALH